MSAVFLILMALDFLGYFFLISVSILMLLPFAIVLVKANYHLEYLKIIYPDKYGGYANFLDTGRNIFYNEHYYLLFPDFKRLSKLETTNELKKLADKIIICCNLFYYSIILLILYVAGWIILSRIISL